MMLKLVFTEALLNSLEKLFAQARPHLCCFTHAGSELRWEEKLTKLGKNEKTDTDKSLTFCFQCVWVFLWRNPDHLLFGARINILGHQLGDVRSHDGQRLQIQPLQWWFAVIHQNCVKDIRVHILTWWNINNPKSKAHDDPSHPMVKP